ncbi:MAG: type 4a pilus biogenesis protein PilO [Patescibacteria group bacterium]|nr:type 4a pilus biogenesis protein PilO [Patescibacteria group bacterium]
MLNFVKKYYRQLITVTIFAVLAFVMFFRSFGIIDMIKTKTEELRQVQLDYALANEFLNNVYIFKKNVAYIDEGVEWMDVLLPDNDDEKVRLFSSLERLAEDTGNDGISLTVKKIANEEIEKNKKVKNDKSTVTPRVDNFLSVDIALVGSYNDLIEFIKKIENMHYFADVTSLRIEKTNIPDNPRSNLLKTTMNVKFYLDSNN